MNWLELMVVAWINLKNFNCFNLELSKISFQFRRQGHTGNKIPPKSPGLSEYCLSGCQLRFKDTGRDGIRSQAT